MPKTIEGKISGAGFKFGLVVSRFNEFITERLLKGCIDSLDRHGANLDDVIIVRVPGSLEMPLAVAKLIEAKRPDAVICLGAIIRGGTPHFEFVAAEATRGIAKISRDTGIPIAMGVITAENIEQAIERAGTKMGNKGWEAAVTAMEMANLVDQLK